ncbi:MAG: hypothetical protein ABSG43_28955 [Solirubrobacteraceae bacterium]|jgi:hypothetical protein
MDISRKPNGKWELRWRESGQRRSRTFDRKGDATAFEADRIRRKQLGHAAVPDDVPLREFVETYWALHAKPNLAESTRDFYARTWVNHIMPRLGDYGVRELTPKRLARFREELEKADIGAATVRKAMAIIQSILSFAVAEELIDFNPAASVRKPRYQRAREPHIFLPAEVEEIRDKLTSPRDRTLVSLLAYSGPRPEEVVCRLAWEDIGERAIRYRDTQASPRPLHAAARPRSPRTCANGSSPPAGPRQSSRSSPPTTAASGPTTTGATGGRGSGEARNGRRTDETSRRTRVPRTTAPARATCVRASSPFRCTQASR